jgi:integrase
MTRRQAKHGRNLRLSTYCQRYLLRNPSLAPNTACRYRSEIECHIIPKLGAVQMRNLTATAIQKFMNALIAKKYAPSTTKGVAKLALRIINAAAAEGLANAINSTCIKWPTNQTVWRAPKGLPFGDVDRILAASSGWPGVLFAVLAMLGLRISEGLGLDWCDVDLHSGTMLVRAQYSRGHLRRLKTVASNAPLPLDPKLKAILTTYWEQQGRPVSGIVFARNGLPRSAKGITECHWRPLLNKLGIKYQSPHNLRHSYCRRLFSENVPVNTIRQLMRHSDLRMTLAYAEVAPDELRRGIARLTWGVETTPISSGYAAEKSQGDADEQRVVQTSAQEKSNAGASAAASHSSLPPDKRMSEPSGRPQEICAYCYQRWSFDKPRPSAVWCPHLQIGATMVNGEWKSTADQAQYRRAINGLR